MLEPGDADRRFRGSLRQESSSFGSFQILVYGSYFHWDDIIYQLIHSWPQLNNFTLDVSGVAIAIIAIAAVGVRRGLAPLRTLATTVASIDVDSLDQRLSTAGAPSETLPFIDAVNAALGRVHEGVARQRRFTANAAHELRSPITIIRSRVETLDESPTKQELSRDVLRMQTIVEQLLVLAKLKERSSAEFEIVDVRRVALAVATDYAPIAIDSGKMIEFEGPPHSVMARGFRWAIESILTNLIANALRAEPKSGTIVVRVGEAAIVEVIDHGAGVAPNERSMIFEQFWRRDENSPGSGLGLTIAQELAHELGGSILVEDTPGGGATFKLSLRFGISADNANSVEKCGREPTP
jgi:signal transduction histidine kinase